MKSASELFLTQQANGHGYSRQRPFAATIKERTLLNRVGSTKKTYHIVLDLQGAHLRYRVGDALAILPTNPPDLVDKLLFLLQVTGKEVITHPRTKESITLHTFFARHIDFMRVPRALLDLMGVREPSAWRGVDVVTLLEKQLPRAGELHQLIACFAPLLPRFYSIASAQAVVGDEAHLLVATFRYTKEGKVHQGIGSQFLSEHAEVGVTPVPMYIQPTTHFTLPDDPQTPILMIGPGTGVAPYRGFLQQRYHEGAQGENWLIFGERHRAFDYYYQSFFEQLLEEQFLRLTTAFSRDQPEKRYVQHCLKGDAEKVWEWLEQKKGRVYICGDKRAMAKDVTATLSEIIETQGGKTARAAADYLKEMRKTKQLLLDVY